MPVSSLVAVVLALACGGELLPDEGVLGDEVPAAVVPGWAGSRLGAAVAVGVLQDGRPAVAISAPDDGRVEVRDRDGELLWALDAGWGLGVGMTWRDGLPVGLLPGEGVVELGPDGPVLLQAAPAARDLAACPDGRLVTVERADEAVACGADGRVLRSSCSAEGSCRVLLDEVEVDEVLPGGDVGFDGDRACWGVIDLDDEEDRGLVRCEDGDARTGILGEHLGVGIAQGWAAGTFTKWEVPARGRVLPVAGRAPDGREAWIVDQAAEATTLSVHASDVLVAVGVPGWLGRQASEGRVFIVDLEALAGSAP